MIDSNTIKILKSVLNKHLQPNCQAFIYGSRTQAKHRKYSDLDVGILGSSKIPSSTLINIQDDLSNSNIPYLTQVVDFSTVTDRFKSQALANIIYL